MTEDIGGGYVKIGVSQEDLEDSITGLESIKPILQRMLLSTSKVNNLAKSDAEELGKHFDTAITAMKMLLLQFPDYAEAR